MFNAQRLKELHDKAITDSFGVVQTSDAIVFNVQAASVWERFIKLVGFKSERSFELYRMYTQSVLAGNRSGRGTFAEFADLLNDRLDLQQEVITNNAKRDNQS